MKRIRGLLSWLVNPRPRLEGLPGLNHAGVGPVEEEIPGATRTRLRIQDVVTNAPLMVGSVIVLGLFVVVLFGPLWAPYNPYLAGQHIKDDPGAGYFGLELPPYPPSEPFPLGTDQFGNDLLSLLLYGARNTLVACTFITMVRVIVGVLLGGIAGWKPGSTADRLIMGAAGVITSVPMLISSIMLIFALDIRRGLPVFIAALSLIGWSEIAQYIRSEFLVLRKMPFVEGARSVGMTGLGVAVRHVLPNVLAQVLVITAMEMGAVMMLLGELGFAGIFIGGGSRISIAASDDSLNIFRLAEVPEWGAMLAVGFRYLRSHPYVVFPAATAFFLSVVGFNTLGEGLRRLIRHAGFGTGFLLRKRMLLVIAGVTLATIFVIDNTGPAPWIEKMAQSFDGSQAYEEVEALSSMEGRGLGQEGASQAAIYIADKFKAYGLRPGWQNREYFYNIEVDFARPVVQPTLELVTGAGETLASFKHQIDFHYLIEGHGGGGVVEAPLVFVGFESGVGAYARESFIGMDLRDRIAVLLQGDTPREFATEALIRGARGILWVAADTAAEAKSQVYGIPQEQEYLRSPRIPIFVVAPPVGGLIIDQAGLTLAELFAEDHQVDQEGEGWFTREMGVNARLSLVLEERQQGELQNVLGYLPGSDLDLADDMVVLFANYDGLGLEPDGTVFPAANHGASGVGVLLEVARLWHEQSLGPRRTVLFVAWAGGDPVASGARSFLEDGNNFRLLPTLNFRASVRPTVILRVDYAGAGGEAILLQSGLSNPEREVLLLREAAEGLGLTVMEAAGVGGSGAISHGIPSLRLSWSNAEVSPDIDNFDLIEMEKLQALGEAFALALTKIVRQTTY